MVDISTYDNRVEYSALVSLNKAQDQITSNGYTVLELELSGSTKYSDDLYMRAKDSISRVHEKCLLICYEKDMMLGNRLLWECNNLNGALYVDTDNPYRPERLVESRDKILWNLQAGFSKESDKAFMSGWKNSYNNELFSEREIREYIENTRMKLKPYLEEDKTVLEIGCGSGMISDALSPLVKEYDGVDISDGVLEKLRISNQENGITNMQLYNLAAHEVGKIGKKYDVILSSSVTEYFSGYNYLRNVVDECIKCIADDGIIFFGDVFDLDLRDQYIESVRRYSQANVEAKTSSSFGFELFVSPRYWFDLAATEKEIHDVVITRKNGLVHNEINRFRYDVLLRVDKKCCKDIIGISPYLFKYQFAGEP